MEFDWINEIGTMAIAISTAGKIIAASCQVCRVSRYASSEICGSDLKFLLQDPENEVDNFISGVSDVKKITSFGKLQLLVKNGGKRPVKGTGIRVDEVGTPVLLILFQIRLDTGDHQDHEIEPGVRDFQIITLGRLTASLINDFRNIFGIVIGYTEMVREGLPPEHSEIRHDLGEVLAACIRAKKLINTINAFIKSTPAVNINLDIERSFIVMIEKIKATLSPKISVDYKTTVTEASIAADPIKLEQLLLGICLAIIEQDNLSISSNSIAISLSDKRKGDSLKEKRFVQVLIQSDALQIRESFIDQFNSSDEMNFRNISGLESVLYSSRSVLRDLNGQMYFDHTATNNLGISILFPVVVNSAMDKPSYSGPQRGKGQYVLVVDDEMQVADLTGERLEKLGYNVVKKTNSIEALEYFTRNFQKFSLLITDQVMPDLSGLEFAKEVKKIKPDIPIIMMTGYSSGITENKCREYGIKSLAMKPIDEKELAALVASAMNQTDLEWHL